MTTSVNDTKCAQVRRYQTIHVHGHVGGLMSGNASTRIP